MRPRRVEVWRLPNDPDGFEAILELPILGWGAQDPDDTPGKGTVSLDSDYEFLDLILASDPTDVAASVSTLICLFGEHNSGVPDFEFFADQRVDPIGDGATTISGPDIRSALNDGKVHPRAPDDPIWFWGQPTLTRNSDLTEGLIADEEFDVWYVADAGTWRIDLGATGWSGDIDWDASSQDVKAAIEAGPSSVVEVNVTGSGEWDDPYKIHIVDPAQTNYSVQVDSTLTLAAVGAEISVRFVHDGGDLKPTYYTPSQTVDGVLHGVQGGHEVVLDPDDGLPSILVSGNSAFIGTQQILDGVSGIHGYASVEIKALVYGANFRLGIRDIDEAWLYTVEAFFNADSTYHTIVIPTFVILPIIDQIILRAAVIDDAPPDFLVRNLRFHRGMPGTTWGDIVLTLTDSIQARGVLTWLDTSGITVALDSGGNAWDNDNLEFRGDPGMDLGTHIMGDGREAGYEYDIVRKAVPVGALTHDLRSWNRGGRGAVKTVDPAIIVGDITSGSIAKRRLPFTHLLVEYGDFKFVEVTHVDFATLPRREGFIRAEQATDEATAIQIGETYIADQVDDILATQINPTSVDPYRDVDVGDQIPYELGKHAGRHNRRIHTIATNYQNELWSSELTASRLFATPAAAQWEATRRLQEFFDRSRFGRDPKPVLPQLARDGGGMPTVTVAASDSTLSSKRKADLVCSGANDQATFREAQRLASQWGRVNLVEGSYECVADQNPMVDMDNIIEGMGNATYIHVVGGGTDGAAFRLNNYSHLRNLWIDYDGGEPTFRIVHAAGGALHIEGLKLEDGSGACYGIFAELGNEPSWLRDLHISTGIGIDIDGGEGVIIDGMYMECGDHAIRNSGSSGDNFILANSYLLSDNTAVELTSLTRVRMYGNYILSNNGHGIDLDSGSGIFEGNWVVQAGDVGILRRNGGSTEAYVIANNRIYRTGQHGIHLSGSGDNVVSNNRINEPGTSADNTYDGIHLSGNSDRNAVQNNRILSSTQTFENARYGINISAGTCNNNVVDGNVIGPSADFQSGIVNDVGSGTQGTNFTV